MRLRRRNRTCELIGHQDEWKALTVNYLGGRVCVCRRCHEVLGVLGPVVAIAPGIEACISTSGRPSDDFHGCTE